MRKINVFLTPILGGAITFLVPSGLSQSADSLIDKLVDKGILTVKEANELREEADKDFTKGFAVKSGMPDWVTSLRIGGDLRGRYDAIWNDDATFKDRERFRYRVRPSITATLKDDFEIGIRLTSGEPRESFGGDPISGNVSYGDNGSKKFIYIDQAYGKWSAIHTPSWTGTFTLGKMENPFVFSDAVFDSDYTPEGFAQQFGYTINDKHALKMNLGQFILDEFSNSSRDPFMFGAQARLESVWSPKISTSLGFSALVISSEETLSEAPAVTTLVQPVNAQGVPTGAPVSITRTGAANAVPNVNSGNSRTAAGVLTQEYNPVVADATLTYTLDHFWQHNAPFPIRVGGDYIYNPGADNNNKAYSVGVTFGKSGKKGLWDLSYRWKSLEADSWYEEMVDSDFGAVYGPASGGRLTYKPGTNLEGHVIRLNYSPYDSLTLGVTYYLVNAINPVPAGYKEDTGRLQVDAVWKF